MEDRGSTMTLSIHSDTPPLRESDDGVIRIGDTRIPLERVVRAFLSGMTPEEIVLSFDALKLEDVYSVVNYYFHHREEVDEYLANAERDAGNIRNEIEKQFDQSGIRARLLARRQPKQPYILDANEIQVSIAAKNSPHDPPVEVLTRNEAISSGLRTFH
jgi:uncharacterized protein (DUF433 family)